MAMSGKPVGFEGPDGSPGEKVNLPYPQTYVLPDVGNIMKDLGIESTISQGIPEGPDDVPVKPGGLGFEGFFGAHSEDVGLPSCQTSGAFPDANQIMKDLSIDSGVSQGTPENIQAASHVSDSPSNFDLGFKADVLNDNQDPQTNKNPPDTASATCFR